MKVIKLTHNDLNEMIARSVRSILKESVKEIQGSIMADREDAIEEIVEYVKKEWERIKKTEAQPYQQSEFGFDDHQGNKFKGIEKSYPIIVPTELTEKLGIAQAFHINVGVNDYLMPEDKAHLFGSAERGTEGTSYGGPEYNQFVRTELKIKRGRIDMYVPSINGELQVRGFYSTLYHELNHAASRLEIQKNHQNLSDDELEQLNFFTASRRKNDPPHYTTNTVMHVPEDPLSILFMGKEGRELKQLQKKISYVFYAIWETTERNARAEAIYGDLKAMGATRENFKEAYPETELYRQINELNKMIDELEQVPESSQLWIFAAKIMNMKQHNRGTFPTVSGTLRFQKAVKEKFLRRSRELLDIMYKKAMKVAELYFQRQEPAKAPSKLELYKQQHKK